MPNLYPYYPMQPNMYQAQQPQQPVPPQQIQNGGFLSVPSEDIVKSYPVAPGNCVTFKIEGKPIVMEKSMGFSQLEAPRIERYRLVKEEAEKPSDLTQGELYDDKPILDTIESLKGQIEAIWGEIEGIKNDGKSETPAKRTAKRSKDGDD